MLTWCQAQTLEYFQYSLPYPFGHDPLDFGDSSSHFGLPWRLRWERICLQCRKLGLTPRWWRSPREGNGHPLQYSYWDNPMERDAWQTSVHVVTVGHGWVTEHISLYIHFVGYIPLYLYFVETFFFNHKWMWNFVKSFFSESFENIISFLFFSLLMWYVTVIDVQLLNHSCIPGISPTWLWYMIFSVYCRIQFVNICWGFLNLCSSETLTSSVVPLAFC